MMHIRAATSADWDQAIALLQAADLPLGGLPDQFPAAYFFADVDGQVAGMVGLECYGEYGLLRSLAVTNKQRGRGLGSALVRHVQHAAVELGLDAIFLLTSTAEPFFQRRAFVPLARHEAPAPMQAAPEFASICPGSATCLRWETSTWHAVSAT